MKRSYTTACGGNIFLTDNTIEHLRAHPEAESLLEQAIGRVTLPNDTFLKNEVVFDRVIGQSSCVPINKDAPAMFAVRIGRKMPTRVAVGAQKKDTNSFVVLARKDNGSGLWRLITGYAGTSAPLEPHDRHFCNPKNRFEFLKALAFWSSHALVWEPELMGDYYESSWKDELTKINHPIVRVVW